MSVTDLSQFKEWETRAMRMVWGFGLSQVITTQRRY